MFSYEAKMNKNVLHLNIIPHRKENLLFLPCNMAAVKNLYCKQRLMFHEDLITDNKFISVDAAQFC